MLWSRSPRLPAILAAVAAIVLPLAAPARADKVDWSQYIDKNPQAPMTPAPAASGPRAKRDVARPAKSVATKPKAKPRAKAKAPHK